MEMIEKIVMWIVGGFVLLLIGKILYEMAGRPFDGQDDNKKKARK
jgi:hypothetical protein